MLLTIIVVLGIFAGAFYIIGSNQKNIVTNNSLNISDVDMEHNYLVIRSRREPNQVYFSPYIAEVLSVYLTKRLELITVYGHDDALFLSLQMKRLGIRSIEKMLKKYSSLLFS